MMVAEAEKKRGGVVWKVLGVCGVAVGGVAAVAAYRNVRGRETEACWLDHEAQGVASSETMTVTLYETQLRDGVDAGQTMTRLRTRQGCKVAVYSLAEADKRSHGAVAQSIAKSIGAPSGHVHVRRDLRMDQQVFQGFGGAFTEAAALSWSKLPRDERDKVIEGYFGETGLKYSMGRVHMNSCDFCVSSYNFAPVEDDWDLDHFDMGVQRDQEHLLPFMRAAMASAKGREDGELKIYASPWSPPGWLKEPFVAPNVEDKAHATPAQSMLFSAEPAGLLHDPRAHRTWATYYSKFISAYKASGIDLWGVTVQNEPEFTAPWEACRYNSTITGDFLKDHLGPVLRRDHPGLLIFAFDHNRDHLFEWATALYSMPHMPKWLDGLAFHWYAGGLDRDLDGAVGHRYVAKTRAWLETNHINRPAAPAKAFLPPMLIASEGCNCPGVGSSNVQRAERYAHDILSDLWHGTVAWVDWNLFLDHRGGPNHLGNVCDAPVVARDANFTAARFQSYFDVIGHFSRHIPPGSVRLGVDHAARGSYGPELRDGKSGATVGFELGLWACEGAATATPRQAWRLQPGGHLLLDDKTHMHDKWKMMCVADKNDETGSVKLSNCQYGKEHDGLSVGAFDVDADGTFRNRWSGKCLVIQQDTAHETVEGQLVMYDDCDKPHNIKLKQNERGEFLAPDGRCLTAGWPYFMAVAFETPAKDVSVVVVNDAPQATQFTVEVDREHIIQSDIPAHSIQTYVISEKKKAM